MSESDLVQAMNGAIDLVYQACQWWITISFALIVATYLAAKHIPAWLFAMIIGLYLLSAASAILELMAWSQQGVYFATRLTQFRAQNQIPDLAVEGGSTLEIVNSLINYVVFSLATIGAAAYSFLTWRAARETPKRESPPTDDLSPTLGHEIRGQTPSA